MSSEALAWRCVELPVDGQTVSLLASVVENPQEFYCHMSNGKGTFFLTFPDVKPKKSLVKLSLNLYWSNNSQMILSNGSSIIVIGFMITVNPSYVKQCCGYELTAVFIQ